MKCIFLLQWDVCNWWDLITWLSVGKEKWRRNHLFWLGLWDTLLEPDPAGGICAAHQQPCWIHWGCLQTDVLLNMSKQARVWPYINTNRPGDCKVNTNKIPLFQPRKRNGEWFNCFSPHSWRRRWPIYKYICGVHCVIRCYRECLFLLNPASILARKTLSFFKVRLHACCSNLCFFLPFLRISPGI